MTRVVDRAEYGDVQDFAAGDRVEFHPASDLWMSGARYGTVTGTASRGTIQIRVDATGRTVARVAADVRLIDRSKVTR